MEVENDLVASLHVTISHPSSLHALLLTLSVAFHPGPVPLIRNLVMGFLEQL